MCNSRASQGFASHILALVYGLEQLHHFLEKRESDNKGIRIGHGIALAGSKTQKEESRQSESHPVVINEEGINGQTGQLFESGFIPAYAERAVKVMLYDIHICTEH